MPPSTMNGSFSGSGKTSSKTPSHSERIQDLMSSSLIRLSVILNSVLFLLALTFQDIAFAATGEAQRSTKTLTDTQRIDSIARKLNFIKDSVDKARIQWQPFDKDCDRDAIRAVEKYTVHQGKLPGDSDFKEAEVRLGGTLPVVYKQLLKRTGSFKIDSLLKLKPPKEVRESYGEVIEGLAPHSLSAPDNLKDGHYHKFIVLAEYGSFPSQIDDYSSLASFNKLKSDEVIISGCDGVWLSSNPKERHPAPAGQKFLGFIENCLDKIIEPLKDSLEELNWQMKEYKKQR